MQTIRILISSPGDVAEERERAKDVIQRLQRRYTRKLELVPVLWEDMFLDAEVSFQEGIEQILGGKNSIDIAVFILWSRLGSPLGKRVLRPDGSQYRSGTEREFELMLQAREQARERGLGDGPAILAYHREDDKGFKRGLLDQPDEHIEEAIRQSRLAKEFIEEHFYDKTDGTNKRAYTTFDGPSSFAARLRVHLQTRLDEYLQGGIWLKEGWDIAEQGAPYRGLESFDVDHEQIFFGREQEVADVQVLLEQQAAREQAFVLMVGPSGSGKSSLARAGVIPAIRHYDSTLSQCRYAVMTPGEYAENLIGGLAKVLSGTTAFPELFNDTQSQTAIADFTEALIDNPVTAVKLVLLPAIRRIQENAGGPVRLVLLVDQLEELFTNPAIGDNGIETFARTLNALASSGSVWVMATLRSDFYGELQQYTDLIELKGTDGQYDVVPLGGAHMHRVITEPAWLAGLQFEEHPEAEERLDQRILSDALEEPDALPLLQYTLRELYENRIENSVLTFGSYQDLGGVTGALGKRAEAVWNALPVESREKVVPQLFRSLVTIEGDRQFGAKILAGDQVQDMAVLEAFVQARLLITASSEDDSSSNVRLAHEALIRSWPRLQQWIDDAQDFLHARSRLENAYNRWHEEKEKEGEIKKANDYLLPMGKPLAEAQDLLTHWHEELRPELQEFIVRSAAYHERRRKKRLRQYQIASTLLLVLATLAIVSGGIAFKQSKKAASTLDLSLQFADKFTIEVVEQLQETWDTPATEKMDLASTTDKRLGTLVSDITGSTYLSRSYGRLLTSISEMAMGLGLTEQASYYAQRTTQLHGDRQNSKQPDILIEEAQSLVSVAEAAAISFDNQLAKKSIEKAISKLNQADPIIKNSSLDQQSRLIRARANSVQVHLTADKGKLIKAIEINTTLISELRKLQQGASTPEIGRKTTQSLLIAYENAKYLQKRTTIKSQNFEVLETDFERGKGYYNDIDSMNYQLMEKRFDILHSSFLLDDGRLGEGITILDEVTPLYDQLLVKDPDNRAWKNLLVKSLHSHQRIADQFGLDEVRDMDAITQEALLAQLRVDGPIDETTWWNQINYHINLAQLKVNKAKKLNEKEKDRKSRFYNQARDQYLQTQMLIDLGVALGAEKEQLVKARHHLSIGLINLNKAENKWGEAEAELQKAIDRLENPTTVSETFQYLWYHYKEVQLLWSQKKPIPENTFDETFAALKKLQEFGVPDQQGVRNYLHRARSNQHYLLGENKKGFQELIQSLAAINKASKEQPLTCADVQNTLYSLQRVFLYQIKDEEWERMGELLQVANSIVQNIPNDLPCAGQEQLVNDWRGMCNTLEAQTVICENNSSLDSENDICAGIDQIEKGLRTGLVSLHEIDTVIDKYSTPDFAPFPPLTAKQLSKVQQRVSLLKTKPWTNTPLMVGNWRELQGEEFTEALDAFKSLDRFKNLHLDDNIVRIRATSLASFPNAQLLEAECVTYTKFPLILPILATPNKVYELIDDYSYILKTADELSINNKEAAADYIRFYFAHVYGRHGRFVIIESEEDVPWLPEASFEQRQEIAKQILPIDMKANPQWVGQWSGTATMMLKDAIFHTKIVIKPNGRVTMYDHSIFGDGIPVKKDHCRYTAVGYITEQNPSFEFSPEAIASPPITGEMWQAPPTIQGSWRTLTGEEFLQALEKFKQAAIEGLPPGLFAAPNFQIRALSLPFYNEGELLEAEYIDGLGNTPVVSILSVPSGVKYLNGESPPIHHTNSKESLSIKTPDLIAAYLRFFCAYVHGNDGPFRIVESPEELPWTEGATDQDKKQIAGLLQPLTVTPDPDKPGNWLAHATIQYSNDLFAANFRIFPSGMIEMLNDIPLIGNLPVTPPKITKRGQIYIKGAKRLQSVQFTSYKNIYKEAIDEVLKKSKKEQPSHWRELVAENLFYEMRKLRSGKKAQKRLNSIVDTSVEWWQNAQDALDSDPSISLSTAENRRTQKLASGILRVALEVADTVTPELKPRIKKELSKMNNSQKHQHASL